MFQIHISYISNHKLIVSSILQSSCQLIKFDLIRAKYHHWKVFFKNIFCDILFHKLHCKILNILVYGTSHITFKNLRRICFILSINCWANLKIKVHRFKTRHLIFSHFNFNLKRHLPNRINFSFFVLILKFCFLVFRRLFFFAKYLLPLNLQISLEIF